MNSLGNAKPVLLGLGEIGYPLQRYSEGDLIQENVMPGRWITPELCPSLAVLIETVTAPLLIQHQSPIGLEVDVDLGIAIPANPTQTAELIRMLVDQSLQEMAEGGELMITACEEASQVTILLFDNGPDAQDRSHRIPMVSTMIGAKLEWISPPEGGVCVRVTIPRRGESRRLAA